MKYLVFSVSGRYWYRAGHCPAGHVDLYARWVEDALAIAEREGIQPSQEDLAWLEEEEDDR